MNGHNSQNGGGHGGSSSPPDSVESMLEYVLEQVKEKGILSERVDRKSKVSDRYVQHSSCSQATTVNQLLLMF